jgi:YcxB-like protein
MEFTLRYSSSRIEVMRLYGRLWRARLWRVHLAMLAGATLGVGALFSVGHGGPLPWLLGALAGLAGIAAMAAAPLLAFKPRERLLMVDANGLTTTIGSRSGALAWRDIDAIDESGDCIHIVRKNLNTFVVPRRAFESDVRRDEFLRATRTWLATSR